MKGSGLTPLGILLFLLYAEAPDLLPVRETLEYAGVSIRALKREIGDAAGSLPDAVPDKLKKHQGFGAALESFRVIQLMAAVGALAFRTETPLSTMRLQPMQLTA
jgi:hypothetical protein